jgi:hypothetical protein
VKTWSAKRWLEINMKQHLIISQYIFAICMLTVTSSLALEPGFVALPTTRPVEPSPKRLRVPSLITIQLDDVDLVDVLRMFSRISGANITYNSKDLRHKNISLNVKNKPWLPTLQTSVAEHGLVVEERPVGSGIYCVVPADNLQELSGLLLAPINKTHSLYEFKLDGGTGSVFLRGEVIWGIRSGTRIWVRGNMKTQLHDSSKEAEPKQSATHWQLLMDVKSVREISKPFERPTDLTKQNSANKKVDHISKR